MWRRRCGDADAATPAASASGFDHPLFRAVVIDADDVARHWMALGEGWQAVVLGLLLTLATGLGLTVPW